MRTLLAVICGVVALSACERPEPGVCDQGPVQLTSGYSGSPASPCLKSAPTRFVVDIVPEAEPINPSPWYAFRLSGPQGRAVTVTLNYAASRHRYRPWIREADGAWRPLAEHRINISDDGAAVELSLQLGHSPTEVAAQPIYDLARYQALETRWQGDWRTAGQSVEGRPIRALVLPPSQAQTTASTRRWIVLLGGQHPPEVPGAWAFEAFADAMVDRHHAGDLNAGLILVPLLNPDGAEAGHWRLNAGLTDLNRDWAARSQPEIRAVTDLLHRHDIRAGDIELMVDFHATIADRLYLPQPDELSPEASQRLDDWLAAMDEEGLFELTDPRRTNPARRVSAKTIFTDEWRAIALTWEAGDTTPEATIRATARQGAMLWE